MTAFYNSTVELAVPQQVTTFTLSDFSRTFQPGSNGGTDHAWGSNHFVLGGAVPEPSTWAMMALGFAGLRFMGWRGARKTIARAV